MVFRSFDIAQPIHLFEELQNVGLQTGAIAQYGTNFNFIDYYKSWTEQPGHPVLNVQVDHSTGRMTIYQVLISKCFLKIVLNHLIYNSVIKTL